MKIDASLLEQAKVEFGKIYGYATNGDLTLLSWRIKTIGAVVELSNNLLYVIAKPDIRTKFLFGYGRNGVASDEEKRIATARLTSVTEREGFIKENLDEFDNDNHLAGDVYYFRKGRGDKRSRIISIVDGKRNGIEKLPKEDVALIRLGLDRVRKDFEKRLETYWKKYGSSKVTAGTYLKNF